MVHDSDSHTLPLHLYLTHVASQVRYRYIQTKPRLPAPFSSDDLCRMAPPNARSWLAATYEWGRSEGAKSQLSTKTEGAQGGGPDSGHAFFHAVARAAQSNFEQTRQAGGQFLILGSHEYPPLLAAIPDPPIILACLGQREILTTRPLSVVGSRKASGWGLRECVTIGMIAASEGTTVVSGGAFGCDIAVHRGMLRAGKAQCPAAVVLASGLGSPYPRAHLGDFRSLVREGGILLSERLWWGQSKPHDFLVRNRIIAGLSPMTIVAEAGERSGALTTARIALDQGRDVVVLRGDENDVRSKGNQQLIAEGAPAFPSAVCLMESRLLQ